ncbi:MAG: hypothetical protein JWP44_4466 [Mucilaginibacter sp.]|nr:hypothetical protein [Mucilaginibacter sp.]
MSLRGTPVHMETDNLTAAKAYSRKDSGKHFTNLGAAGAVVVTLPTDSQKDDVFHMSVQAAQSFTVNPGIATEVFRLVGVAQTAGHGIVSSTLGDVMTFVNLGAGVWQCRGAVQGFTAN